MGNFYEAQIAHNGHFAGGVLVQAKGEVGGFRHVFVALAGPKAGVMYPTHGGMIKNPFPGRAKMYAGDLVEYRTDGTCLLLKTYEVSTESSGDVVYISSGKCPQGEIFRHIPFVGDVLMVAPDEIDGTGTAATVIAVENTFDAIDGRQNGWKVTLSATLGSLAQGDILVEAEESGSSKKAKVTNPNCYLDKDYDMIYEPATGDEDFDNARYFFTPVLMMGREFAYINRMQPLPDSIKALNKSKVDGWYLL
ncbi:MAG: hypothetical protein K2H16_08155 [Prevotella sp.]|nr:hypothetical protein [Prevotella sp.]MDE6152309.1 hypothetical protein [Prevotella sp.]